MPAPTLLSTTPSLSQICTKVLGHANPGDSLTACFTQANGFYPSYYDPTYVGSKDRQSNFAKFGQPYVTVSSSYLEWEYNQTTTKTVSVTCNHTKWKFHTDSDTTGFTVAVYDSGNTVYIGAFSTVTLWDSDVTLRVTPNANNNGGSSKYCYLYIGTYNNYLIEGGTVSGEQHYQGYGTPPIVVISSSDPTMTISGTGSTLAAMSTSLYFYFTPANISNPPKSVYVTVTKTGGTVIATGSLTNVYNGVQRNKTMTLSEGIPGGAYCYVDLTTTLI